MKKHFVTIATILLLLISAANTFAQTRQVLKASIPFDFTVNNKPFAAGEYLIEKSRFTGNDCVRIQSRDGKNGILTLTQAYQNNAYRTDGELIFQLRDNQYTLALIKEAGNTENRLVQKAATVERLASGKTQIVAIAAHR